LAEIRPIVNDPVAGLIDIPLPQSVSLWPQTWTSRIAIVVLLAALVAAIWEFVRYRRANRYRREALSELERTLDAGPSPTESAAQLAALVRRTALAVFPREKVASLAGPRWLAFLDGTYDRPQFSQGVGQLLVDAPYAQAPPDDSQLRSLAELVRRWIRVHHV
jgi:Ca-activated chloride channel family protein